MIQASEEDGFSIHDDLMADFSATLTVPQEFPSLQAGNRSADRKSVSSLCYKLYAYCRHGPYEKPPWVQLEGCERNSLSHVLESDEGQLQESSNALTFIHGTPTEGLIAVSVSRDILAGDTGCHEWEAGFFLSEYVLNNPDIFKGKHQSCFPYCLKDQHRQQ